MLRPSENQQLQIIYSAFQLLRWAFDGKALQHLWCFVCTRLSCHRWYISQRTLVSSVWCCLHKAVKKHISYSGRIRFLDQDICSTTPLNYKAVLSHIWPFWNCAVLSVAVLSVDICTHLLTRGWQSFQQYLMAIWGQVCPEFIIMYSGKCQRDFHTRIKMI